MAHPVGGPLRGLAICLREELNIQKEPAFQMARRLLKGMNGRGFVVRRGDGADTRADAAELEEILRWLERQPAVPVSAPPVASLPTPPEEVALPAAAEPPAKGKRKRSKVTEPTLPLFDDVSVEVLAPVVEVAVAAAPAFPKPPEMLAPEPAQSVLASPPAPSLPPPAPAFDATPLLHLALDAHDALLAHRPDLAREALEVIIEILSGHAT